MPYGRSLTYRFAQSAFYAACLWAGLAPLPLQPAAHLLLQRRPNGGVNLYAPAEVEKNDHGQ